MKDSLLYMLVILLSRRNFVVIKGYLLPLQQLHLSHALLTIKGKSSQKKFKADLFLNRDKTISHRNDYSEDTRKEIVSGTLNLIKALAGTGILALPMGVAQSSDFKTSIVPAICLMSILGIISTYTFILYGRLVHASQAKTLGELWEKQMDKNSAWVVSAVSLIFCFGACLSYTLCLGDVSSSLAKTVGLHGVLTTRQFWITFLTTTILYPLCNLKSLISLAPLSLAGVGAVLITAIFIAWRCPLVNHRSPYSMQGPGRLLKTLSTDQVPRFQTFNKGFLHTSSLILFGMAASAYLGHFTAPDLYHTLGKESNDSEDDIYGTADGVEGNVRKLCNGQLTALNSYYRISLGGFMSTITINCLMMAFGFLTFGGNAKGVILNNFSTLDKGATFCRFLTAVSVIGGYPFLISACRGELLKLYNLKTGRKATPKDEKFTTTMLLSSLILISMVVSDAGLIIGLAGAVMGNVLVYIFPSLLYLSSTKTTIQPKTKLMIFERIFCRFLVIFGAFTAFAGAFTIIKGL